MKLSHQYSADTRGSAAPRNTTVALTVKATKTATAILATTAASPTISGTGLAVALPLARAPYDEVAAACRGAPGAFPYADEDEDIRGSPCSPAGALVTPNGHTVHSSH